MVGIWGTQVFTQVVLAVLLFGSMVANFAALADCGRRALAQLAKHSFAYHVLAGWEGRGIMVVLTLFPILPLCCLKGCVPVIPPFSGLVLQYARSGLDMFRNPGLVL
jgi:hypothetical protein